MQPREVNESIVTSTSVLLQWDVPVDPNGVVIEYRVNVMAISSDPDAFTSEGEGGRRRRRRRRRKRTSDAGVIMPCIVPGGDVGVDTNITTTATSLELMNLSECQ